MSTVWMVRAGDEGRLIRQFRDGLIGIEFDRLGDMTSARDLDDIQAAYQAAYPDSSPHSSIIRAGIFYKFKALVGAPEDAIITYDPHRREYLVGKISGEYEYVPAGGDGCKHVRKVTWQGSVKRDLLTVAAKRSLQSQLTIFEVGEAVWQEIQRLLEPRQEETAFFGFLDELSDTSASLTLTFDAIAVADFETLAKAEGPEALLDVTPVQFQLCATGKKLRDAAASAVKRDGLHRWFKLQIQQGDSASQSVLSMTVWKEGRLSRVIDVSVTLCEADDVERLNGIFNLARLKSEGADAVSKVIAQVAATTHGLCHVAYNVGEGMSSALHHCLEGTQSVYFDVGAGRGVRNETCPVGGAFQPAEGAVVILSHWHRDHWSAAEYVAPRLKELTWITPFQHPIGVSHMRLAAEVHKHGKLVVWSNESNSAAVVERGGMRLVKLPNVPRDEDCSGLVVALVSGDEETSSATVIPGDASYESFRHYIDDLKIGVLFVPNHGGASEGEPPMPSRLLNKLIYSYGKSNCYGQPSEEVVARHVERRWLNRKDTVNGTVLVTPFSCPLTACSAQVEQS